MRGPLSLAAATILQKAALDEGFDIDLGESGGWLKFESTQTPVAIALTADGAEWVAAVSGASVSVELRHDGVPAAPFAPPGYNAAFLLDDAASLHRLLARARMLGRSLPTAPLDRFVRHSRALPSVTEAERLVIQRIGQDIFREALIEFWNGRCPLTGIDDPLLLRASHMKPWADCVTDAERLDVYNGLLLAAHLDVAFDAGLISFDEGGSIVLSFCVSAENATRLGLTSSLGLRLSAPHLPFMRWHRLHVFRR
jgi:putative restriction endonuclease